MSRCPSTAVFHSEWPSLVFGRLRFHEVTYLQCQVQTTWGYQLRALAEAPLPSRGTVDATEQIFEFFAPDGGELSAFVVAAGLTASK